MAKIIVDAWKCMRCGYTWLGRKKKAPKCCPKCRSYKWQTRRRLT